MNEWWNVYLETKKKNATRFGKVLKFIIKIFRLFSPLGQLSTTYDVHTCWGQILGFFEFCYTFKVSKLTLNLDLIFVVLICRKFLGAAEKRRGCTDGGAVKGYKVLIFIVLILFWKVSNNEKQHFFWGDFAVFTRLPGQTKMWPKWQTQNLESIKSQSFEIKLNFRTMIILSSSPFWTSLMIISLLCLWWPGSWWWRWWWSVWEMC